MGRTVVGRAELASLIASFWAWGSPVRLEVVPKWSPFARAVELWLYSFHFGSPVSELEARCDCELVLLREGSPAEEAFLAAFIERAMIRERFARGQICFAWRRGLELLSYVWVSSSPEAVEELVQKVRPHRDEIYLFDALTAAEFRGRGLYAALLAAVLRHYEHRGVKRALIFSTRENIGSRKGIRRAGFTLFQVVKCWKVLRVCIYWLGPILTARDTPISLEPWR